MELGCEKQVIILASESPASGRSASLKIRRKKKRGYGGGHQITKEVIKIFTRLRKHNIFVLLTICYLILGMFNYGMGALSTVYEIPAVNSLRLTGQVMPTHADYFQNQAKRRLRTRGGKYKDHEWVCFPDYNLQDISSRISITCKASLVREGSGYFLFVMGSKTPYEMGPPKTSNDGIGFLAICIRPNGELALRDHANNLNTIGTTQQLALNSEITDFELQVDIIPSEGNDYNAYMVITTTGRYDGQWTSPALWQSRFKGYFGIGAHLSSEWEFWDVCIGPGNNVPTIIQPLNRTVRFVRYTLECQKDGRVAPRVMVCLDRPNGIPLTVKTKPYGSPDPEYSNEQTWKDVLSGEDGSQEMSQQGDMRLQGFATFTHLVTGVDCSATSINVGVFRGADKLVEFDIDGKWPGTGTSGTILWLGAFSHSVITRHTWPVTYGEPDTRPGWKSNDVFKSAGLNVAGGQITSWTPTLTPTGTDWGCRYLLGHNPLACIVGDDAIYPDGRSMPWTCQGTEWEVFLVWGLCTDLYNLCVCTPVYWSAGDHDRNVDGHGAAGCGIYRGSGPPEHPWPGYYNEQVRRLYSACNGNSLDGGDGPFYWEVGELAFGWSEDSRFSQTLPPPSPTMDTAYTANGIHVLNRIDSLVRTAPRHFLFSHGDYSLAHIWRDYEWEDMSYYRAEQKMQVSWHCDCQMMRVIGDRHCSDYIRYTDFSGLTGVPTEEFEDFDNINIPEVMIGTVRQNSFRDANKSRRTEDGAICTKVKDLGSYLSYMTTFLDPATGLIQIRHWRLFVPTDDASQPWYTVNEYRNGLGYQDSECRLPRVKVEYDNGEAARFAVVKVTGPKNQLITIRYTNADGKLPPLATKYDSGTVIHISAESSDGKVAQQDLTVGSREEAKVVLK